MDGVQQFLETHGMLKYYDMFKAKGYDLESDIPHLTADELQDVLLVSCPKDRATLLSEAQSFTPSSQHIVYEWLRGCSLDYYFISFVQSELTDLQAIAELQLPDEDLYDELELVLPGHRKRLERAVQKLKLDQMKTAKAEIPVTFGWWGKPKCLPQAKFDFLCVKAFLSSTQDLTNPAAVDFMVDSGSDVSTVQESILDGLNLELIGPVYSCGVHGGNHCNLYRACLAIGDVQMEIEVMGSNYNSLGSRVVRHFRHVIDGQRHIWLTGNYQDPLPAILPLHVSQTSSFAEVQALPNSSCAGSPTVTDTSPSQDSAHSPSLTSEKQQRPLVHSFVNQNKESKDDISTSLVLKSGGTTSSPDLTIPRKEKDIQDPPSLKEKLPHLETTNSNSMTYDSHSGPKSTDPDSAKAESKGKLSTTDQPNNQRMSLSNVVPANLRDTDDDVDHHERPQLLHSPSSVTNSSTLLQRPANGEQAVFAVINNSSSLKNNEDLQLCPDKPLQTKYISHECSNSAPCSTNFVQASSDVVLLTLDDLDDHPQLDKSSCDPDKDSRFIEKRKDPQTIVEEGVYSPSKKLKLDNSSNC